MTADYVEGCTCPRVRHRHGMNSTYQRHKCHCPECREAYRLAKKHERNGIHQQVPAAKVLPHLHRLKSTGMTNYDIAKASGLCDQTVWRVLTGRTTLLPRRTAQGLLHVMPIASANDLIPAVGTRRRLQALSVNGWTAHRLADHMGIAPTTITRQLAGQRDYVCRWVAERTIAAYDELWSTPPIPRNSAELAGIHARIRTARALGWVPPLAWDDATIDDPKARPHGAVRAA